MAVINLDVEKIKSINDDLESSNATLLNNYFPNLVDLLGNIKTNVKNYQLNSILNTITSQVNGVSANLKKDLPTVTSFLESQMKSYVLSEEEAESAVNEVLGEMESFAKTNTKRKNSLVAGMLATVGGFTAMGASIGSVVPGVGTVVGGFAGFYIGSVVATVEAVSSYGGFDGMIERMSDDLSTAATAISTTASNAWNAIWD